MPVRVRTSISHTADAGVALGRPYVRVYRRPYRAAPDCFSWTRMMTSISRAKRLSRAQIWTAKPSHVSAIMPLLEEMRHHLRSSEPSTATLRRRLAGLLRKRDAVFFLAGVDDVCVGLLQLRLRLTLWSSTGREAEIEDLIISDGFRRLGIGSQLVRHAVAEARKRGCGSIGLHTNTNNRSAVALYRAAGFRCERPRWANGRQLWFAKEL